MQLATCSAESARLTPSASRTSALPDLLLTLRLPCLAIFAPAPAATNIAAVEILKVWAPSPPVPTTSTKCALSSTWTGVANSRITWAAAAISPTVSFFVRSATNRPATIVGGISPLMMRRIIVVISSWNNSRCSMQRCKASWGVIVMAFCWVLCIYLDSKKFFKSTCPYSDRIDSGWNCTPSTANSRWRTPMISPSEEVAVISSTAGILLFSIAKEW